ncbi:TPA: hypothetical protein DCW38_06745 [candidate division WOR-3 bacterium]|jgi:NAD(P)-dependent dehydrogenase (short-subunit alcohol dehydrogenase family)|uniref:SDR family oxidoreductase n=1 Tax=candidate division WOR-3 bacterium TaxID=2052148 RepID=A0A350HBE5_UNCW3|nr:hypothetical protein [candidate division WOR-3 bacterium]
MSKVVVITGVSYGLGLALLQNFSENDSYSVAGISRTLKPDEKERLLLFKGDITKTKDIESFYDRIMKKWGGFDVLINNAGIVGEFKEITEYSEDEVNKIIDINIKATFIMTQKGIELIRRPGYIVNIGSTRSITGAPNKSIYSMTKFALRGLTQSINSEWKAKGICSTIVCPGSFKTVPLKTIAGVVQDLLEMPVSAHVPEVIIGGML